MYTVDTALIELIMIEQLHVYEPFHEKTCFFVFFVYAKTKMQISFLLTAKLISAFVFATNAQLVRFLYFINPTFLFSNHLLCLYSLVCVGPGRKLEKKIA